MPTKCNNFQEEQLNSRRFPVFPEGVTNSSISGISISCRRPAANRPQYRDPGFDVVECLLVKQQVFEPCQRTVLVHRSTLLKYVTVSLEVVARRTCT